MPIEKFQQLREKYNSGTATREERIEYYTLILSGEYEEEDFDRVRESVDGYHTPTPEELALLEKVRAGIPLHQSKVRKLQPWKYAAAAAAILIFGAVGLIIYTNSSDSSIVNRNSSLNENKLASVTELTFKGPDFIRLPDSSTVLLQPNSSLSYSTDYGTTSREVKLTGVGFFDVAHNPDKKFQVITNDVTTTVLGTAFNINTSKNGAVEVTVTRGKVSVSGKGKELGVITPNQQLLVNTADNSFERKAISSEKVTDWKEHYIIIDNATLEDAVKVLSQRYNVSIEVVSENMKHCRVTTEFFTETNLEDVLGVIAPIAHGAFRKDQSGRILLEGEGCSK